MARTVRVHPVRSGMQVVESVRRDEIALVERRLTQDHGQLFADIWVFGINVALRISDLLAIQMADVVGVRTLTLIESKTGKRLTIQLNERARSVVTRRSAAYPYDRYLFQSHSNRARALHKPVTRQSVARAFQDVGRTVGIALGTHSMRKTRGRALFEAGVPLAMIAKLLNHTSTAMTLRYIGIERRDLDRTYDEYVL